MDLDLAQAADPQAAAVLLHPHPHFGGDRFHPFVDGLYRSLPGEGVTAARFDFDTADPEAASDAVRAALAEVSSRAPGVPLVLAGYSFGAGIAARVDDAAVAGWYLLAAPVQMLGASPIGGDPRPKALTTPAHDQFSPLDAVDDLTADWVATERTTLDGADHFLAGVIDRVVAHATTWITALVASA